MMLTSLTTIVLVMTLTLSACATPPSVVELYGQPALPSAANRTIVITPEMRYVNVEGGQIIRFVVGDKVFAWNFNTAGTVSSFNLNDVAPSGVLTQPVRAYVAPDPKYIGNGRDQSK